MEWSGVEWALQIHLYKHTPCFTNPLHSTPLLFMFYNMPAFDCDSLNVDFKGGNEMIC